MNTKQHEELDAEHFERMLIHRAISFDNITYRDYSPMTQLGMGLNIYEVFEQGTKGVVSCALSWR